MSQPTLDEDAEAFGLFVRGGESPERAYQKLARFIGEPRARAALAAHERAAGIIRVLEDPLVITKRIRAWYAGPRDDDKCWPALRRYLAEDRRWPDAAVDGIDRASSKILAHMQPAGLGRIDTRGLVVGYVQSGKTANYTALIAKAADVGYRFFVILAGVHNSLRRQTQTRLERELVELNKQIWATLTSQSEDFRPSAGGNTDAFLSDASHLRILCVVKKNASVLRRLKRWLGNGSAAVLSSCPVLIVDDEADQAGLNAHRNPDERTVINRLILETMEMLPKAAYVGYTATPFANVLVDPSGRDLYPKDFIVELPRPEGYCGSELLFGREKVPTDEDDFESADGLDMIRTVPEEDVPLVRPRGPGDRTTFVPELAPSLDEALRYFVLASAARRVRGPRAHESMLIHTTLYADPHEKLREVIANACVSMLRLLEREDEARLSSMRQQWEDETKRVPANRFSLTPVGFDDLRPHLEAVVADAELIVENGSSLDRLVFGAAPTTQIAIGGNTLSRGLTLEGLTVSYFVRSASAYDTLLQMGRWFGYRFGYEDLPRIWMTSELRGYFRDLATVEHEIRLDIRKYDAEELTPEQFAVRIRTHPALTVTSKLKMKHAVECGVSYGGTTLQTTIFEHQNAAVLKTNLEAAERLVSAMGTPDEGDRSDGRVVWYGVGVENVLDFLDRYRFHDRRPDLNAGAIQGYVKAQNDVGALRRWTVVLAGVKKGLRGTRTFGGTSVNLLNRSQSAPETGQQHASIGTVTTQSDLEIGREERRRVPDSGLLLLYPIAKDSGATAVGRAPLDAVDDVLAVAFDFPSATTETPQYVRVDLPVPQMDEEETFEDVEATQQG